MAKSRRNRARPRKDPLAKAAKPPSDPELAAIREKSVLPVLRDLQSSEPKARASAAAAVANLVSDARCRKLFLREQIVHTVLTQTITDASIESRAAGWDILRLLAEEEEADFCVHLYRQDVLTALDHAATAVVADLRPGRHLGTVEAKFVWAVAASLVALVSVMSEAQDDILEAVVALPSALALLAHAVALPAAPAPLRYDALSCLMTLAEDNQRVAEFLVADATPKPMTALLALQAGTGPARVLACGVLHNVFAVLGWHAGGPGNKDMSDASLVRSLASALDDTGREKGLPLSCQWSKPAEVLQLALEVLASIGTSLQVSMVNGKGDDEWSGIEDKDDGDDAMEEDDVVKPSKGGDDDDEDADDSKIQDDDMEEDEDDDDIADIIEDMDMVTGVDEDDETPAGSGSDELATLRELTTNALPKMARLANPEAQSDDALQVQAFALSALGNIAWSVSIFDFSHDDNAPILKLWAPAARFVWEHVVAPVLGADTADVDLADSITSLAWAISRALAVDALPLQGTEHRRFISLYGASRGLSAGGNPQQQQGQTPTGARRADSDPLQGLGVKCIGVLGQLARHPAPAELNREIGVFLLTVISSLPDSPAADVVEALNQLFDIYADEEHPCDKEVFWKDNFLSHLEGLVPKVRAVVKTVDKRTHAELRTRADEAVTNLTRFLAYKKKHKPQAAA